MITINFFNGFQKLMADRTPHDRDLRSWANIEYKNDSDYAYITFKKTGMMPEAGVNL